MSVTILYINKRIVYNKANKIINIDQDTLFDLLQCNSVIVPIQNLQNLSILDFYL